MEALTVSPFHVPRVVISTEEDSSVVAYEGVYLVDPVRAEFFAFEGRSPVVVAGASLSEALLQLCRQSTRLFIEGDIDKSRWDWLYKLDSCRWEVREIFATAVGWYENGAPDRSCSLSIMELEEGRVYLSLMVTGLQKRFRHHGGWHNVAKFEKRSARLDAAFEAMRRTLREWENNPLWRWWYHINHRISWDD